MIISVNRKTQIEKRYSPHMGELTIPVTYIQYVFFGVPVKTIHKYRETYYGEIKSCSNCDANL